MKITIDTKAKTIQVDGSVNYAEFQKELKEMLGDRLNEYMLINPVTVINLNPAPAYPDWIVSVYPHPLEPIYMDERYTPPYHITCGIPGLLPSATS